MTEDFKTLKETILKAVFSAGAENGSRGTATIKDIVNVLASIAGKGKDEIVQIISREIGTAVAAALKEPVGKALKDKKLRITIDFIPDDSSKNLSKKAHKKRQKI